MQLGYYHYYIKQVRQRNAPRISYDIRSLLNAYLAYDDIEWKKELESNDGEKLLLMPTAANDVYMLVATRQQDIIKAISTQTLSCADIYDRLEAGETAGFAAYFKVTTRVIALASSLRGPRTAALSRFLNQILNKLGVQTWKIHLQSVGSSITIEQARALAHVASTKIRVGPQNELFRKIKELFSVDCDDVGSFEVIIRGKRRRNLKDVFEDISESVVGGDLEKMTARGKAHLDDVLSDFYVEADGKFSEDIGTGTEEQITRKIASRVSQQQQLPELLTHLISEAHYEQLEIPQLDSLGDVSHWHNVLSSDEDDTLE